MIYWVTTGIPFLKLTELIHYNGYKIELSNIGKNFSPIILNLILTTNYFTDFAFKNSDGLAVTRLISLKLDHWSKPIVNEIWDIKYITSNILGLDWMDFIL